MSTRVYQYGLLSPTENDALVRAQLRAAHEYRNDLVAIERGRRAALRAIDATSDEVREAEEIVKAATRSTRKAAVTALRAARKRARDAAADELAAIAEREHAILLDARALTTTFWGTYLDIEAAHRQSRQQPLYGDDAVTPNDPAFARGPRWRDAFSSDDPRGTWWLSDGQLGIQLQGGLPMARALAGTDTRLRIEITGEGSRGRRYGVLSLRIGSDGRAPIWARWPIKMHRPLPDGAMVRWARVSVTSEATREVWSCEITVDDPTLIQRPRGAGAVAVQWEWSPVDGGIRVARWADGHGGSGEIVLPARLVSGLRKPSGIRAVRDLVINEMHPRLSRAIKEGATRDTPRYVVEAANVMHLWRSPKRWRELWMRWRLEPAERQVPCAALDILSDWEKREWHLHWYDDGARGEALRERRDWYRVLAAQWRRRYETVLLSDQDLSREARWGDDSDVRFVAGVSELRSALRNAFGRNAIDARWSKADKEAAEDGREWCERSRDAWIAGGPREGGMFAERKEQTRNAWTDRKAKKKRAASDLGAARKPSPEAAE